jgi:hypothetical protein
MAKPSTDFSSTDVVDSALHLEIRSHLSHIRGIDTSEIQMTKKKVQRMGLALSQPLTAICRRHMEGFDVLIQVLLERDMILPVQKPLVAKQSVPFTKIIIY